MKTQSACPDTQLLRQLRSGSLPDDLAEPLEQHVLTCPQCIQVMTTLRDRDALVEALRPGDPAREIPQGPEVENLVTRMRDLTHSMAGTSAADATLLAGPPASVAAEYSYLSPPQAPDELGRLGNYRVLRVLGSGGMGVVFAAEDVQLQRLVALKVMRGEVAVNAEHRERFLREARACAAIEHDNILGIYQVGEQNGAPFLAIPLLRGETLQVRVNRDGRLPPAEILRIGRETAAGLGAAHESGLIHRDIKPQNLWLEAGSGRVKILDFGLARREREDVRLTKAGYILGTPAFMSPEQASGQAIDGRGDLYSLGVVLYWLCAGRLPFPQEGLIEVLTAVATEPPPPLGQLNPELPPALVDLIMRLLAKRPDDRPASAGAVVQAIRAIENGTVQPRPPSSRGRLPVVAGVLLAAAVAGYLLWPRGAPSVRTGETPRTPGRLDMEPAPGTVAGPGGTTQEPAPTVGEIRTFSGHTHTVAAVAFLPDGDRAVSASWDRTLRLWNLRTGQQLGAPLEGHAGAVRCVAFAPDGQRVASGGADQTVRLWEIDSREARVLKGHSNAVTGVAFGPEGRLLVSAGNDRTVQEWNGHNGKGLASLPADRMGPLECVAVSRDGIFVACGGQDQLLHLWQIDGERYVRSFSGHAGVVQSVAFSPDGRTIVSGGSDGTVRTWEVSSGKAGSVLRYTDAVQSVACTPDGKHVLAAYRDGSIRLWDLAGEREVHAYKGHRGRVWSVAVSGDGRHVLSGGDDQLVRLWGLPPMN
jgi:hypothetical protein